MLRHSFCASPTQAASAAPVASRASSSAQRSAEDVMVFRAARNPLQSFSRERDASQSLRKLSATAQPR